MRGKGQGAQGLGLEPAMSQEQIGAMFGITRERVRQIELRALTKLRRALRRLAAEGDDGAAEICEQFRERVGESSVPQSRDADDTDGSGSVGTYSLQSRMNRDSVPQSRDGAYSLQPIGAQRRC